MLSNFLVYTFNDMVVPLITWFNFHYKREFLPKYSLNLSNGAHYTFDLIIKMLLTLFSPVVANNLWVLFCMILGIYFAYLLFKELSEHKTLSLIMALAYVFHPYFFFRVISLTPDLYQIYIFPLLILLLIKKVRPLYIALFLFISFTLSSYYAFFSFVLVLFWYIALFFVREIRFVAMVSAVTKVYLPLLFLIVVFYPKLFLYNLPIFGKYSPTESSDNPVSTSIVYRPLEDFYNFSFRPWYFMLPPEDALFFGDFTDVALKKISSTNYYLADDYTAQEMGGSYMGWHILIISLLALTSLLLGFPIKYKDTILKSVVLRSFIIIFLILLITGPPSFTISGYEIFTPSYLLYLLVPVFRTLVRWAIVIYLLLQIISLTFFVELFSIFMHKRVSSLVLIVLFMVNSLLFGMHLPTIDLSDPPEYVSFIGTLPEDSLLAFFPEASYENLFWINYHKKAILNPSHLKGASFSAKDFTTNLVTANGFTLLFAEKVDYLIIRKNSINYSNLVSVNPALVSDAQVFNYFESKGLEKLFENEGFLIYELN